MPPLYFWRWPGAGRAGDPDTAARSSATTPDADLTKGLERDHLDTVQDLRVEKASAHSPFQSREAHQFFYSSTTADLLAVIPVKLSVVPSPAKR